MEMERHPATDARREAMPVQGLRGGYYQAPNYWHRIIRGELVTSLMSNEEVRAYLASIGRKGGQKSRRTLTPEQAKAMVRAREKKRRATKRALRRSNDKLTDSRPTTT